MSFMITIPGKKFDVVCMRLQKESILYNDIELNE